MPKGWHVGTRMHYSEHSIGRRDGAIDVGLMPQTRDPVNELYDHGCDLVEAASAMRRAATAADAARAAPAILGCIETALDELMDASAALETAAHRAVEAREADCDADLRERHHRMRGGFANLADALCAARDLAAAARTRTSIALARAGVTQTGH
jgi:hypothetical protein